MVDFCVRGVIPLYEESKFKELLLTILVFTPFNDVIAGAGGGGGDVVSSKDSSTNSRLKFGDE